MERASLSVDWLVQARLDRQWTQAYVAEAVGVEVKTVRRWELGCHKPRPIQYRQLCKLFGRVEKELVPAQAMERGQALLIIPAYDVSDS